MLSLVTGASSGIGLQYATQLARDYHTDLLLVSNQEKELQEVAENLAKEYGVSHASISNWTSQFRNECQTNEEAKEDYDYMKANLELRKKLAELEKENEFLKKAAAFFAKGID